MAKENCGCWIQPEGPRQYREIRYCPTHAAAFEMREALKEIVTAFDKESVVVFERPDALKRVTINSIKQQGPTFLDICKRALSLAEGKEADRGR